jgi:putative modified peptide
MMQVDQSRSKRGDAAMPALSSEQTMALLKKLATDDNYRSLFQKDLGGALAQLPGKPAIPAGVESGGCLRPVQLASKAAIEASLEALHDRMVGNDNHIPKLLEA